MCVFLFFFVFVCFALSVESKICWRLLKIQTTNYYYYKRNSRNTQGLLFFRVPIIFYSRHFFQSIIVVARGQRSRQAGVKREVKALSPGCVPDVFPLHDIAGCGSAARDVTAAPTPVIGSKPRAKGKVHPFYTGFSRRGRVCVCVLAHTHSHSPCTLLGRIFTPLALGGERRGRVQR